MISHSPPHVVHASRVRYDAYFIAEETKTQGRVTIGYKPLNNIIVTLPSVGSAILSTHISLRTCLPEHIVVGGRGACKRNQGLEREAMKGTRGL